MEEGRKEEGREGREYRHFRPIQAPLQVPKGT
jgi:hypothetical protein